MNSWFSEDQTKHLRISFRIERVLHRERSPYQEIAVYETAEFGRLLALDDVVMTTERDEFVYHEMLVHPALTAHPGPEEVLVVGGGDGGTVREVLKHRSVRRVVLAEIDERVVAVSRQYLPSLASGLADPRVEFAIGDGAKYVAEHPGSFDAVLVDSTDPVGPGVVLFEEPFYRAARKALRPGGVFAAQSESPWFNGPLIQRVQSALSAAFPRAWLYLANVPTYPGGYWAFACASLGPDVSEPRRERARGLATRYYSPEVHRAAFVLPPFVREAAGLPPEA